MDLSGVIFVVLALAWAAYLLPKALKHHDEIASTRPVDRFSPAVRVLSRHPRSSTDFSSADPRAERDERGGVVLERAEPPEPATAPAAVAARPLVTRASARRAAQRRRRVLMGLLVVLLVVVGCAFFAVVPWIAVAAPLLLVVGFLVTARLSVRRTEQAHVGPLAAAVDRSEPVSAPVAQERPSHSSGLTHDQLAAEVAAPLEDEGSLWDPLPLTLPTYVGKAKALRTVRTIELTGMTGATGPVPGVVSAGHDAADSALVRDHEADDVHEETQQRRAAGA